MLDRECWLGRCKDNLDRDAGHRFNLEAPADMSKSRRAGFLEYETSADSFLELFEQMRTERIIPRYR